MNEPTPRDSATVADLSAIRAKIIGDRESIATLARALNVCERSIYNVVARYRIPTVKFLGKQYADPAAIGAALQAQQTAATPRRPGRPRKNAHAAA
jgi:hypothetical protein